MADPTAKASGSKDKAPVRERLIDALMSLATTMDWRDIDIGNIAREADVSLLEFRDTFPSKGAIFAAFWKRIDREVLKNPDRNHDGENHRERLFELYMRRFDAMAPYRRALAKIMPRLCLEPLTLAALNRQAINAQRFLLAAAGIRSGGMLGHLRVQGAVLVFTRTMEVWLRDESAGLDKTMSTLNRELRRAERIDIRTRSFRKAVSPLCTIGGSFLEFGSQLARCRHKTRRDGKEDQDPAAAI